MSSTRSTPSPEARESSTTTAAEVPFRGGPHEVGVELEEVGPVPRESSRASADRDTNRPLRRMCFLVENCKWCRPEANSQGGDRGTLPEPVESPAVNALRECLETLEILERDRLEAKARRARCPTLMERCLALRSKAV